LSNWLNAAEKALTALYKKTKIPYEFEFWNVKERGELPDAYIVYFLVSEPSALSFDGKEKSSIPRIQVSFYYRKKSSLPTMMDTIKDYFLSNGFVRAGSGRIPYQKDTGHYGWRYDFNYYERR